MIKPIPLDIPANKFWSRVQVGDSSECWEWTGRRHQRSLYGVFRHGGKQYFAHRVAYVLWHQRDISASLVTDHLCRNRACCNPSHLEPVTPAENSRRGETGKRSSLRRPVIDGITYCGNWHPVEGANRSVVWDGRRQEFRVQCLGCIRMWNARYRKAA